jgi:hypothetical protein
MGAAMALTLKRPALAAFGALASALLATATELHPQTDGGKVQLQAGVAPALARTSVGGETSTDAGPLLTGQVGIPVSTRSHLTIGVVFQPFKAHNPVADERYSGVYSLAGLQVGLGQTRRFHVRPELGLVFRSWSGTEVFVSSETALALGLAFGREWPLGRKMGLAVEGFARLSGADELATVLLGIGVSVIPVGARR